MTEALPQNATLHDLRLPPKEAASFARKVLGVMRVAQRDNASVVIRLGVTGTGVAPNYRLETPDGNLIGAIDGANHQPWPSDSRFDGAETWSSAIMLYEDVEDVIGSITGYQRGGAARA